MLGDVLERSGRAREAEREWLLAAQGLRTLHMVEYELDAVESLKELYAREHRFEDALRMTDRWAVLKDSMAVMNAGKEILRMEFEDQAVADSTASAHRLQREQQESEVRIARERTRRNIFLFSGLGLLVFGVVVFRQRRRIQKALHRSEELLLNILPEEVAEELKAKGQADAKHFDQVTMLFTDFKGFTAMSEKLSPAGTGGRPATSASRPSIASCTRTASRRSRPSAMRTWPPVACPTPNSTHAADVDPGGPGDARLHRRRQGAEDRGRASPIFEIRIGIHTGPVVAGHRGREEVRLRHLGRYREHRQPHGKQSARWGR